MDLSIIIPSKDEPYLNETVKDILEKATSDIEIIVNLDNELPQSLVNENGGVTYIHSTQPKGMRGGVNAGLQMATGDYVMKCDAHCLFAEGFDETILKDFQDNWLVIPRRYSLYADGWKRDMRFPPKDYHYLSYPTDSRTYGRSIFPQEWKERAIERAEYLIDDTMTFQGSCYIANRKYFMKHVGFLDDKPDTYTQFAGEPLEVGLKYWLGGGEVKVNKHTWYAHLFKNKNFYKNVAGSHAKRFKIDTKTAGGHSYGAKHWMGNEEPNMIHPFSWLIEKFWPVPGWPEDRKLWTI